MFNFLGQNKSMWGTPGMPMWGGGNNVNTQGMWGGGGFFGGAGGQWQDQPIKTLDIRSQGGAPGGDQTLAQQGMQQPPPNQGNGIPPNGMFLGFGNLNQGNGGLEAQPFKGPAGGYPVDTSIGNFQQMIPGGNQYGSRNGASPITPGNPWASQMTQNNPYMFGLGQGRMRPPQNFGQSGVNAFMPQQGGNPFMNMGGGGMFGGRQQNPQMQQQNIMQLMQLMQMMRGGQGGGNMMNFMGPARAPQGWTGGQDSNRDGSVGNPNPYLYNGKPIIPL